MPASSSSQSSTQSSNTSGGSGRTSSSVPNASTSRNTQATLGRIVFMEPEVKYNPKNRGEMIAYWEKTLKDEFGEIPERLQFSPEDREDPQGAITKSMRAKANQIVITLARRRQGLSIDEDDDEFHNLVGDPSDGYPEFDEDGNMVFPNITEEQWLELARMLNVPM